MVKYCQKGVKIYIKDKSCDKYKHWTKLDYKFAIISAFAPEQTVLNTKYQKVFKPYDKAGRRFNIGIINGNLVVSVLSGVSLVNSTLTSQLLVTIFNPKYMFFSGIAGGINPGNNIGDVVICKQWFNIHQQKYIRSYVVDNKLTNSFFDISPNFPNEFFVGSDGKVNNFTRPGVEGADNPIVPPASNVINIGANPPLITTNMAIPMSVDNLTQPEDAYLPIVPQKFFFPVNCTMLKATQQAITKGITLPKICLNDDCSEFYFPIVKIGDTGMTSCTFVDNAEWRQDIFKQFSDDGVIVELADMETIGISQVAESNKIPFLAIRSMSDLAGGEAGPNVLSQFFQTAADNAVMVLLSIMSEL